MSEPRLTSVQVPSAFALLYVPHFYATLSAGKAYNIAQPRQFEEHLAKDESIDKVVSLARSSSLPTPRLSFPGPD